MKSNASLLTTLAMAVAAMIVAETQAEERGPVLYRMPSVEQVFRGQSDELPVQDVSYFGGEIGKGAIGSGNSGKGGHFGNGLGKGGDGCGAGLVDSAQLILGFDAWAARLDDDDWNNFGMRSGFNVARRFRDTDWYGQLGVVYGVYDWDGHEMGDATDNEEQVFVTMGAFRRANLCEDRSLTAGFTLDYMHDENVGEEHNQAIDLYQTRWRLGWARSDCDEVGFIGAFSVGNNETYISGNQGALSINTIDHVSMYWERRFDNNARLMASLGWLAEPGELLFAVNGEVPFNDSLSMTGNFVYGKPSTSAGDFAPNMVEQSYSEAYWNIGMGFIYYYRGGVGCDSTPLMPVGNNGNFMVGAPVGAL